MCRNSDFDTHTSVLFQLEIIEGGFKTIYSVEFTMVYLLTYFNFFPEGTCALQRETERKKERESEKAPYGGQSGRNASFSISFPSEF